MESRQASGMMDGLINFPSMINFLTSSGYVQILKLKRVIAGHYRDGTSLSEGLDVCEQFMDVNEMIRDEDLIMQRSNSPGNGVAAQYYSSRPVDNIRHFVAKMVPTVRSRRPSARELNLLKRKAKISSKDQTKGWNKDGDTEAPQPQDIISPRSMCPDMSSSNKLLGENISDEDVLEYDGDKTWQFQSFVEQLILDMFDPLWEVRHGSVMAMREILTHQGANAGVIIPDLRCEGALNVKIKESLDNDTVKRERPIDLNMQVPPDELESVSKKLKVEPEDASYFPMDTMVCTSRDGDPGGVGVKVEDAGLSLAAERANGEFSIGSVKLESQSHLSGGSLGNDMSEEKEGGVDKTSMEKMGILENLPENCELMNLVKLARHSWLKNCEFLQDCAIRFLCVLSLERFGDYVSDQVVAPVRETCAQALGVVLKYMHPTLVHETLNILLQMQVNMSQA
ncbi:TATA-binding protein-associated factor BTAF1 [Capsicum chinense]|nr:TATA-binding protein-associated factor BTAF1 [Capsicum chinense]